ncbi:MAG TPA: nitrate- and nitrite sensing domain-containing protein, partial [Pseudonocardiaceae bacterium]|nr:nitrate- and nitrite sensing domain-containing protein [Pseudonocardiaceae bacterium]
MSKRDRPPEPGQAAAPDPAQRGDRTSAGPAHRLADRVTDESGDGSNRPRPTGIAGERSPYRIVANWRLRQKLAAVLVLPVLATVVFAGLAIRSEIADVRQLGSVLDELALGRQAADVGEALQRERDAAMVVAASGKVDGNADYQQAAVATDAQASSLRTMAAQDTDVNPGVGEAVSAGLEALDGTDELRSSVQTTGYPATAALSEYDRVIAATIEVNRAVAADATSAGTTPQAASLYLVALEDLAQQESIMVIMAEQPGSVSPALSTDLNSATTAYSSDFATFTSVATPDERQQVQDTVSGADVDNQARYVQIALAESAAGKPLTVAASDIQPVASNTVALGWQVEQSLLNQIQNTVQGLKSSTVTGLATNIATVVAIVLVVLAIMLAMSAAMVRPLRLLRGSALEVARATLPDAVERILASEDPIEASADAIDPIPPYTREEVGDVARSFDVVHGQAVRLAAEQAVLRDNVNAIFVNLARRSQVLVERQLSLIDR